MFALLGALLVPVTLTASPAAAAESNVGLAMYGDSTGWKRTSFTADPKFTATFLEADGFSLNNCGGPLTTLQEACNFAYSYVVGGTTYTPNTPGTADSINLVNFGKSTEATFKCPQAGQGNNPLTMQGCFNKNSYGEVFMPASSGQLKSFNMWLTCLNKSGLGKFNVSLYEVSLGTGMTQQMGSNSVKEDAIVTTPVASALVDLSTCPDQASWNNYQFTASSFASIDLFKNLATKPTVSSSKYYAVLFSGDIVPGTQPAGSPGAAAATGGTTPTITTGGITPSTGPVAGGTSVTITGSNLTGATVTIGGQPCTVTASTATSVTCTTPAGTAGAKDVVVTTTAGSATSTGGFTYGSGTSGAAIAQPSTVTVNNGGNGALTIPGAPTDGSLIVSPTVSNSAGIASATITNGNLQFTVKPGFSGKTSVPLQQTINGVPTIVQVPVVINPTTPSDAQAESMTSGKVTAKSGLRPVNTTITWKPSPNATGYKIVIDGKVVGTSTGTSYTLNFVLGPKNKVQIVPLGNDGTTGDAAAADVSSAPVTIAKANFSSGSAVLTAETKRALDQVAALVRAKGFTTVTLTGHTDNVGSKASAVQLSALRSKTVRAYLAAKLGSGVKVVAKSAADTEPVANNASATGRAANRRVDVTVG